MRRHREHARCRQCEKDHGADQSHHSIHDPGTTEPQCSLLKTDHGFEFVAGTRMSRRHSIRG